MYKSCQACGTPLFSQDFFGMEAESTYRQEYCGGCYMGGHFYTQDWDGSLTSSASPSLWQRAF